MKEDLAELKEKISCFVNNYDIKDITIYIEEYLNDKKQVRIEIEV